MNLQTRKKIKYLILSIESYCTQEMDAKEAVVWWFTS